MPLLVLSEEAKFLIVSSVGDKTLKRSFSS
jgi:hypothetical protein